MKIFISWSGKRSNAVAMMLKDWLKCVLQAVNPWVSSEDLESGTVWFSEILGELEKAEVGIVCLTKENIMKPWVLFESGAIVNGLTHRRVHTFLVDLAESDLGPPLSHFNHTIFTKESVRKLIGCINMQINEDWRLETHIVSQVFDAYWPKFESGFNQILSKYPEVTHIPERTSEDKLTEILHSIKGLDRRMGQLENELERLPPKTTGFGNFVNHKSANRHAVYWHGRALLDGSRDIDDVRAELMKKYSDPDLITQICNEILKDTGTIAGFTGGGNLLSQ